MADDWQKNHFKREDQLDKEIKQYDAKHGNYTFPASMGIRKAKLQIEWWAHSIKDPAVRKKFVFEANKLISGKKFAKGMDVPRGVDIEYLFYKIAHGYSDEQYAEHLRSYD
jgi:hypothetical protein